MISRLRPKPATSGLPEISSEKVQRLQAAAEVMDARRRELGALQGAGPGGATLAEREAALAEARGRLAQLRHEAKAGLPVPAEDIVAAEAGVVAAERERDAARPDPEGQRRAVEAARQRLDEAQDALAAAHREAVAPIQEHAERRLIALSNELAGVLALQDALGLAEPAAHWPRPVIRDERGEDMMLTAQPSAEIMELAATLRPAVQSWRRANSRLLR